MKKITKNRFVSLCLFVTAVLLLLGSTVFAQNAGDLDTGYGSGGTALTNLGTTQGNAFFDRMAVQSDGKSVGLIDAHLNTGNSYTNAVIRFNTDGSLDGGFAGDGILELNWTTPTGGFSNIYGMTLSNVDGDEKIVLAGSYGGGTTLRVERYNSDGTPDTTFDGDGTAMHNVGYALTVAAQPDGKILTMGDAGAFVRLNADGSLDSGFGTGGVVQLSTTRGYSLEVQPSGKILMCGNVSVKGKNSLSVLRFNVNGSADDGSRNDSTPGDSFGTAGRTGIDFFSGGSWASNTKNDYMKLDAAGRILVAVEALQKSGKDGYFAIARLTPDGQFDTTFDADGKATFNVTANSDSPRSISIQSSGQIILTGMIQPQAGNNALGIIRLNPNGSRDSTFSPVIRDNSSGGEWNYAGRIQNDPLCACQKLVVFGTAETEAIDYVLTTRYWLYQPTPLP